MAPSNVPRIGAMLLPTRLEGAPAAPAARRRLRRLGIRHLKLSSPGKPDLDLSLDLAVDLDQGLGLA